MNQFPGLWATRHAGEKLLSKINHPWEQDWMHVGFGWCLEQCVVLLNRRLKIPTENWAQSNKNGNFHSEHSLCTHFKLQQQPNIVLGSKLVGSYLVNFWLMQVSNLHVVCFSSELGHGTTLSSTWIKLKVLNGRLKPIWPVVFKMWYYWP